MDPHNLLLGMWNFNSLYLSYLISEMSKEDTLEVNNVGRTRHMSALDRFDLLKFDHQTDIFGQRLLSVVGRCLLYSMFALDRFQNFEK